MRVFFVIIVSYLIGSISFAMLIAKIKGIDLRKIGSGNLGATNLSRACGKKWAYLCFVLDVLKGFVPTFIAVKIVGQSQLYLPLFAGAATILGHIFPLYLKFKGGKGVATSFGVVLGIWPYYTLPGILAFVLWAVIVLIWKYISLASVIASAVFPIIIAVFTVCLENWKFSAVWPLITVAAVLGAMVIFLHRANIKRLLAGTENKVLQKNAAGK